MALASSPLPRHPRFLISNSRWVPSLPAEDGLTHLAKAGPSPRTFLGHPGEAGDDAPSSLLPGPFESFQQVRQEPGGVGGRGQRSPTGARLAADNFHFYSVELSEQLSARVAARKEAPLSPHQSLARRRASGSPRVSERGSWQLLPLTPEAKRVKPSSWRGRADVPSGAPGSFQYNKPTFLQLRAFPERPCQLRRLQPKPPALPSSLLTSQSASSGPHHSAP